MTEASYLSTTRTAYDAAAVRYAEQVGDHLVDLPLDRALIAAFAELVRATDAGPVADLGCGPGRVTAHLHSLGLPAFGVDLSPTMIDLARQAHPDLRFEVGSMTDLDIGDGTLAGVLAWYSIIHTPPEELPAVLTELHRVLAPGGHLLVAFFQADDESGVLAEPFDHRVTPGYRWSVDGFAELLHKAGFTESARLRREPNETERFPRGHLLVRKPAG
ncbi:class I SAM-dependent DNA methyltransferase [Actinoallomurus bryophytorum]|uniref:class I SAM-dependent DNA methyltransferase n=1 Tax=Actinoallomurus bryophytorum TaxID=1490222 RepID=UPI00115132A4|nr:class I SAM-dependent methyltransferase [Actinoallomurus bryophytorum]